jgi:hypothetical protein
LAGDTLNITCNFLYCNHQMHIDILTTLYMFSFRAKSVTISQHSTNKLQNVVSAIFIPFRLKHVRILKFLLKYEYLRKNNMHTVDRGLWIGKKFVFTRKLIPSPLK